MIGMMAWQWRRFFDAALPANREREDSLASFCTTLVEPSRSRRLVSSTDRRDRVWPRRLRRKGEWWKPTSTT
jgi:hypothetical protein